MAMDSYAMKTMIYDTARKYDEGKPISFEASACKLFTSEAVCRVTDKALLVFGGLKECRPPEAGKASRRR
jgi:alkylation response protein AidB-like acyl-CoA dehydrogenase